MPSPPRVIVPPPEIDTNGRPNLHIEQHLQHDFGSSEFGNSEFLQSVSYDDFLTRHTMLNWKYEWRRHAQQILPFLFLGPITAARDRDFLQKNDITMLLAVRDIKSVHAKLLGSKVAQDLGIPCANVDTSGKQELIAAFPRGIKMINNHLSDMHRQRQTTAKDFAPGRVLVFCESGNERSAAMVVAYIMAMYSMDVIKAIQITQAQRFAAAFDDSLKHLLHTYDSILQARRLVVQNGLQEVSSSAILRKPSKRTLDDAYDDMEMDGVANDEARFVKRERVAPFGDNAG